MIKTGQSVPRLTGDPADTSESNAPAFSSAELSVSVIKTTQVGMHWQADEIHTSSDT